MYADVRPSQDNRVSQRIAYSILIEKYARKKYLGLNYPLFRIYKVDFGHMFPGHVTIFWYAKWFAAT